QLRAAYGPRWWRSGGWWVAAARRTLLPYLLWLGCAALTMFVVWPAMWVEPFKAVLDMIDEAIFNGGEPHAWGNYFLGRSIADPGPLFYPVAVLWRSSPLMLIGLLALPLAFLKNRKPRTIESPLPVVRGQLQSATNNGQRTTDNGQLVYLALLGWVLLF